MHVVHVACAWPPAAESAESCLHDFPTLPGWAEGTAAAGAQVTAVWAAPFTETLARGDVTYRFVRDEQGRLNLSWRGRSRSLERAVLDARPDVVHFQGVVYPGQLWCLRRRLPRRVPIVVQDHASLPWTDHRAVAQRLALRRADMVIFCAKPQADPWLARGMIRGADRVGEIMEGSTLFGPGEMAAARRESGFDGEPAWLWVGSLDPIKDPLTVLDGLVPLLAENPAARLHLVYGTAPIGDAVAARIAASPVLTAQTVDHGRLPHAALEAIYRSCHYFVLGSSREGSGYALCEAMACGVVPVITNIPSFAMMTGEGRVGGLWTVGAAATLTATARAVLAMPWQEASADVLAFFHQRLSFAAIGREALALYEAAAARRGRR